MRKFKLTSVLLVFVLLLAACSSANTSTSGEVAPGGSASPDSSANYDKGYAESPAEDMVTAPGEPRKIIITYNLELDTKEYTESINKINALLRENGGYTLSLNESSYGTRYVTMQMKVPKDKAEAFVNGIAGSEGINLISRSMDSSDVTSEYTDSELRLKTKREKLERLYALQKDQKDLETLLQLETEISNTIYEIESLEMELKNLDSKIDYSTINIELREVSTSTTTYTKLSFAERITEAFGSSFESFIWFMEGLVIGIIYFFPYIILLVLAVFVVRYFYKKFLKNKNSINVTKSTKISDLFDKKDENTDNKN